jgi:hypothetical protein
MSCLPLTGTGLTNLQYIQYTNAWNTFNRIQRYDSNVSTAVHNGATGLQYYNFSNYIEKNAFIQGQQLHIKLYPSFSTLWYTVEKN